MKICFLFPYFKPHFGGVERVLDEVSKRIKGFEVHVITSKLPGTLEFECVDGVFIHRIPSFLPEKIPYPIPKKLGLDVLRGIKGIQPDIIVAHNVVSYYTPIALIAKLLYKKPLILTMHTTDLNYGVGTLNWILRAYYLAFGLTRNFFDGIVTPMENKLFRLKPDVIIPNGVDTEKFRKGDKRSARRKLKLAAEGKIVLFVGRFIPVKGLNNLINIANSLEEAVLVCVGEGYLENEIREKIRGVIIRKPTEDIHFYYQAADACIIPSLAEGFCLTAVEAYACETPIVGSNVGIIPKLTDNIFDSQDWQGMRDCLTRTISGETLKKNEYEISSWDEITDKYEKLLESLQDAKT